MIAQEMGGSLTVIVIDLDFFLCEEKYGLGAPRGCAPEPIM